MTQAKRIDELTARIDAIETRLVAIEGPQTQKEQKKTRPKVTRISYNLEPDPAPLEPLTPEETAFLKKLGFPADQKTMQVGLYLNQLTPHDKQMIQSIKKKRKLITNLYV